MIASDLRAGFAAEGGGFGGTVFIFGALLSGVECFFRRNDPAESAVFAEDALKETGIAGDKRKGGTKKVGSVLGVGLVGVAVFDLVEQLGKFQIGSTQASDSRIVLLNQAEQRHILKIGGVAYFHQRFGGTFFGRIQLGEVGAEDVRLPEVALGGDGFLVGVI